MSNPSRAKGTRAETAFTRWGNEKWPNPTDPSPDGEYVRRITLPGQFDRGDVSIRVPVYTFPRDTELPRTSKPIVCNVQLKNAKTWLLKKWLADCDTQAAHAGVPVILVVKPDGVSLISVHLWVVVYNEGDAIHYRTVGDHFA